MEYVNTDSVRKAFNIFLKLIEKSEIKKSDDPELFSQYDDAEVSHLIHDVIETEAGIMVIRAGDTLYYSPLIDNKLLGFTNAELRSALRVSNNTELYVSYIIILAIMIKFYNGENYNNKCRTMLKVEELEKYITQKMETIVRLEEDRGGMDVTGKEDNVAEDSATIDGAINGKTDGAVSRETIDEKTIDEKLSYNFTSVARLWLDLPAYDEKIIQYSLSTGTRISYIFKTMKFLREQGLANIDNENEIFTTNKMDALVMGYYPENNRKKEILSFLEGV